MAPSRGKGKAPARAAAAFTTGVRTGRRSRDARNDVPDVYQSMLDEAEHDLSDTLDRPLKRRRVATAVPTSRNSHQIRSDSPASDGTAATSMAGEPFSAARLAASNLQTVEQSSEDDASDLEFEDVDIGGPINSDNDQFDGIEDLTISVENDSGARRTAVQSRRKPATVAEKAQRLLVHKLHMLCLLGHCMYVNGRCNNAVVQKHLRPLLTTKTVSYLNPKLGDTQFQRNRSFMDGLQQAVDSFSAEYRITSGGMTKPRWDPEGESGRKYDFAPPMDRSDFILAAKDLEGTQDTGNQLFCAMLRSAGVDARVVCSLQVLPFTSVPKQSTPQKPAKATMYVVSPDVPEDNSRDDAAVRGSKSIGSVPSVRRRLGQPAFATTPSPAAVPKKKTRSVPKASYPVFWTEAFNAAQQKWISVDPIVTHTVNKPAQLEPPASYELNQLTYVIAFEDDGTARDVTRRYAKAYNAKTRRHRVEASVEGTKWFKKAMRIFRRQGGLSDHDQVEDAELAQKEAREGMPANVLDFKDHPYYALERHLKRQEVIHPKREVGKVNAGTAAKPRVEPVYRRQDVFVCKSADKWYRLGREIKQGEQPLKHVPSRSRRQLSPDDVDDDGSAATTGLYAPYQTQLYVPPSVQRGRIPKNRFGNLDIYVPSMVPAGGEHIRHELAQEAAKFLRFDYADAVTGFKFQGRHGTAVIEGVVVARQYADAVRTIVEGFEYEKKEEESKARSLVALKFWKRFLTGLRIAERVSTYGDGDVKTRESVEDLEPAPLFAVDNDRPLITAGQFSLRELTTPGKKKKKKKRRVEDGEDDYEIEDEDPQFDGEEPGRFLSNDDAYLPGGFVPEGAPGESQGGFLPEHEDRGDGGFIPDNEHDHETESLPGHGDDGGGFIADDEGGGGFMPVEDDADDLFGETPAANVPRTDPEMQKPETIAPNELAAASPAGIFNEHPVQDDEAMKLQIDTQPRSSTDTAPALESKGDEAESDTTSMPSHDPEDDDAEPDWLESD